MKKNIRKVLALLAAVAMMLTVLPLGALVSADSNPVKNGDFETGTTEGWNTNEANVFEIVENVGGSGNYSAYIEYKVNWGNIYQGFNVEKNTDYVFSYRYKADAGFSMIYSVQGSDWSTSLAKETFDCTGEWVENSVSFNSGDFNYIIIYVQSNHDAAANHKVYVDDVCISKAPVEPEEPEEPEATGNLIVNGDFETGDKTGWDVAADKITATAAKDGGYGLLATGGAYAGGSTTVAVEPNTTYIFSIDVKSPAGDNAMMYIKRLDADGDEVVGQENPGISVNGTEWTTFTKEIDSGDAVILQLQLCCGWDGTDKYFDNASLVKKEISTEPSFDGYLYNGDFETGDLTKWEAHCADVFVTDEEAYTGDYSLVLGCGDAWAATLMQKNIKVEKNTDYVLSYYAIGVDGEPTTEEADFKVEFRSTSGETVLKFADATLKDGLGCKLTDEWTKYEAVFNTGDADNIFMKLFAFGTGNVLLIDDIKIEKKASEPEIPDEPDEPEEPTIPEAPYEDTFEDGNADDWKISGDGGSGITDEDAANGNYAFAIKGTASEDYDNTAESPLVAVKAGKTYKVSFMGKYVPGTASGAAIALSITNYFDTQRGSKETLKKTDWPRLSDSWKEYSYEVTPTQDGYLSMMFINCNANYYIDDFKVVQVGGDEPEVPAFGFVNGDFETGDKTGWETHQSTVISEEASYSGDYGANLIGDGGWGGMLNQTLTGLTVGKEYKLSFMLKVNATGVNVQVKLNSSDKNNIEGCGGWYDKNKAGEWTKIEYTFVAPAESIFVNFCGGGNGNAEDVYVDDFVIVDPNADEPEEPEVPGNVVVNGDFETGDLTGWESWQSTTVSDEASYNGEYGVHLVGNGGWGGLLKQDFTGLKAGEIYVANMWIKTNGAGVNIQFKDSDKVDPEILKSNNFYTDPAEYSDWVYASFYIIPKADTMYINICGAGTGTAEDVYIDDIELKLYVEPGSGDEPEAPSNVVVNGDFETGDLTGWESWQQTEVNEEASYNGNYGIHLKGDGGWGGLLKQDFTGLEAGEIYVANMWIKTNGAGVNIQFKDSDKVDPEILKSNNFYTDPAEYSDWVYASFYIIPKADTMYINICGAGTGSAEDVYIDDIELKLYVEPGNEDEDNLVKNGSFENGTDNWDVKKPTCLLDSTDAHTGANSMLLEANDSQWGECVMQKVKIQKDTVYVLVWWSKRIEGDGPWCLWAMDWKNVCDLDKSTGTIIDGQYAFGHSNANWVEHRLEFNSGEIEELMLKFGPDSNTPGIMLVDDIGLYVKGTEPEPTVPEKPVVPMTMLSYGTVNNRPMSADKNLLANGSFESAEGLDSILGTTVQIVDDPTAPDGSKSLFFNTAGVEEKDKHVIYVDVEPETDYVFSAWLKGAFISADNRYDATIGIVNPENNKYLTINDFLFSTNKRQLVPTAWDNEWHLRSMTFNSGSSTKVGIALYGSYSQMWVDDIALFKNGDGKKYVSENMGGNISVDFDSVEFNGADDKDNLIVDPTFSTGSLDFWKNGNGFGLGIIDIAENEYEYGNSLKYTASKNPVGYYYINWLDVEPKTNYTFSVDVKILESGAGKLALMDGKIRHNVNFIEVSFSQEDYGDEWFTLTFNLNTDVYDTLGIGICDLGGSALIDNIRLFKTENGKEIVDDYIDPPAKDGWVKDGSNWTYYENGKQVKSKWIKDGSWYYIDGNGYMVSDKWVKDSKGWCYLGSNGAMVTNKWVKDSIGWCYVGADGYAVTNTWKKDSVGWCYLNASGSMVKNNWVHDGTGWYFLDANGYMVSSTWKKDSKGWVYLGSNGKMATNAWIKDSVGWCYVGSDGYCVTEKWMKDSKGWVYLDASGRMATNKWIKDSVGWCYVDGSGYCVTNSWKKDSKGWCYLDANGRLTTNKWVKDNGKWYYMDGNGYMLANTSATIGGKKYNFNASGVCTNP